MTLYTVKISIDDNFGVTNNSWGPNATTTRCPDGIKSISGSDAVVDESILKGVNSWIPVNSLMSKNFDLRYSTQEEFREHMSGFGKFTINGDTLDFDSDNVYDLRHARFLDNDSRGEEFNTIDIWYNNNPISNVFIKLNNGYTLIDIGTFSKSYYVYIETDWWYFTDCISRELSIQEVRNIKLKQIFDEENNLHSNILRQLKFKNKNGGLSNSFLVSVENFYHKNGFITDKQTSAIKREIW